MQERIDDNSVQFEFNSEKPMLLDRHGDNHLKYTEQLQDVKPRHLVVSDRNTGSVSNESG